MMKKVILSLVLVVLVVCFTSCKTEKKETLNEAELVVVEYQCPMKCEDHKTYTNKDVKCPVCKMDLVEVKKDEENHDH